MNVADQVSKNLNKLIDAINDVKTTVEAETYVVDPNLSLVIPELVPPIKVQIHGASLEIGTTTAAFDNVVKEFATLQIKFSKLSLGEVYEIQ